jgi:lipopolysaccharide biosynthesis protein
VFNTTINHYRELIVDYRAPVLKIELLRDNPLDLDLGAWEKVISENSSYNITLIKKHLKRIQQ